MSERGILFRGKRVDNGEWVYGNYHNHSSEKSISFYKVFVGTPMTMYAVTPDTVGQYTGLKDKNGTRTFEGDIIKQVIPHNLVRPLTFTVNWCEECAMFVLPCITNGAFESDFTVMRSDEIEIIGNIYDNPELLKGEQT